MGLHRDDILDGMKHGASGRAPWILVRAKAVRPRTITTTRCRPSKTPRSGREGSRASSTSANRRSDRRVDQTRALLRRRSAAPVTATRTSTDGTSPRSPRWSRDRACRGYTGAARSRRTSIPRGHYLVWSGEGPDEEPGKRVAAVRVACPGLLRASATRSRLERIRYTIRRGTGHRCPRRARMGWDGAADRHGRRHPQITFEPIVK